jgi:hypothetical protein
MRQLVYTSRVTTALSHEQLQQMLIGFRANNIVAGISGVLLHSWGNFLQVLEGDDAVVERLFHNILNDTRHTEVVIEEVTLPPMSFEDWTMGFVDLTESSKTLEGYAGFPSDINLRLIDPSIIIDLLIQVRTHSAAGT